MTEGKRRLAIIHNPISGFRNKSRFARALLALSEADCEVEILKTERPRHAEDLAKELAARNDPDLAIVAAGGDGTVAEILNGLDDARVPLGVIPLGTANVLARELGIGTSIQKAVETLVTATPCLVHSGRANERRFLLMVGAGYDSLAVAALNPAEKRKFGAIAYVLAGFRAIGSFGALQLRLRTESEVSSGGTIIVTNVRHYGGGFIIAPDAGLERPGFDVLILKGSGFFNAIRYGLALISGRLPHLKDVEMWQDLREMTLEADQPFPCQYDGDGGLLTPVHITFKENSILILKPADS